MYKTGFDRDQLAFFPTSLNEVIDKNSIVFVIDAFVDSLNLIDFNFKYAVPSSKGNRPYDPKDLLKLYLFAYHHNQRSSRTLQYFAKNNIECIWLLKGLSPDFRTISDFRKDNKDNLKKIFYEFNLSLKKLGFLSSINSQDGVKVIAVNSKDKNFTRNKIDDRLKNLKKHIDDYFNILDLSDELDDKHDYINDFDKLKSLLDDADKIILSNKDIDKDEYINKFKSYIEKLEYLKSLEKDMLDNNKTQISLTDPEAKLMRNNGKFDVAFNNQVLVDENHFVSDFQVTDKPADLGTITELAKDAKDVYGFDTITDITDKGYHDRDDMMNALQNGIIPQVTPDDGKDSFLLETDFVDNSITDDMINSTNPNDLTACLQAGVIPNIYKDNIDSIEIKDSHKFIDVDNIKDNDLSEDELRDLAVNNQWFTRHIKSDKVFCPMGQTLRKKSSNKDGTRYCNKLACQNCKNPCCNSSYKTVDFSDSKIVVVPKTSENKNKTQFKKKKRKKLKIKKVVIKFKVDKDLIKIRMSLSELPHAQIKRCRGCYHTLLKGMSKVTGEYSIYYTSENILHAKNLLGVDNLVNFFKNKTKNLLVV